MSEEKTEKKKKNRKRPTYLGHLGPTYRTAAQAHLAPLSSSSAAASSSVAGMPRPPCHLLAWRLPSPLDTPWRRLKAATPIPPLQSHLPLLSRPFRRRP